MMENKDFAVFILTHKRADRVFTVNSLKKCGYTGKVYFIIDDTDVEADKYIENFGDENVIIFNKKEIAKEFDEMDTFDDMRAVVYARNASFDIAKKLGVKYFMLLDDDYSGFYFRYNNKLEFCTIAVDNLDRVFDILLDYYKSIPAKTIAMAQSGDFMSGAENRFVESVLRKRKCMNTFICSVDRPFKFIGKINEDTNLYANNAKYGDIFLTIPYVTVVQKETQSNQGGLTDIYLSLGTYVKSFYTVMLQPSSVKVGLMGSAHKRLHHKVNWEHTCPMIINEKYKKK